MQRARAILFTFGGPTSVAPIPNWSGRFELCVPAFRRICFYKVAN